MHSLLATVNRTLTNLQALSNVYSSSTIDDIKTNVSAVVTMAMEAHTAASAAVAPLSTYISYALSKAELVTLKGKFEGTGASVIWATHSNSTSTGPTAGGSTARANLRNTLASIQTKINNWPTMSTLSQNLGIVTAKSAVLRAQLVLLLQAFDALYTPSQFVFDANTQYQPMIDANTRADSLIMSFNQTALASLLGKMQDGEIIYKELALKR
jgi:hypothetical protein